MFVGVFEGVFVGVMVLVVVCCFVRLRGLMFGELFQGSDDHLLCGGSKSLPDAFDPDSEVFDHPETVV